MKGTKTMAKAKKSKKDAKVVVNAMYFDLIERKSALLSRLFDDFEDKLSVGPADFKEWDQIQKAWEKIDVGFEDTRPYEEPAEGSG